MPNAVKYWNGSSWQSPGYFGQTRMWDGTQWRMVEVKYAGGAGTSNWNVPAGTLDVQTVTSSYYQYTDFDVGYTEAFAGIHVYGGSISDGTSNIYSGASISGLYYSYNSLYTPDSVVLEINGYSLANSGWTNIQIGNLSFTRASAVYNTYVGPPAITQWVWFAPSSNPFGTTNGTQVQVFFS